MKDGREVCVVGRGGVIPALESLMDLDFCSFLTTNESDSSSGSFSLESSPMLEPIPAVKFV